MRASQSGCRSRRVVYANLSSLVATPGLNFMVRGLILIVTEGRSIALVHLRDTTAFRVLSGDNVTWRPTSGDGYRMPILASVFVGGTPTGGGVGTIAGGAIGALIVSFIRTAIVGAELPGFYVQFFNGLIRSLATAGTRRATGNRKFGKSQDCPGLSKP